MVSRGSFSVDFLLMGDLLLKIYTRLPENKPAASSENRPEKNRVSVKPPKNAFLVIFQALIFRDELGGYFFVYPRWTSINNTSHKEKRIG